MLRQVYLHANQNSDHFVIVAMVNQNEELHMGMLLEKVVRKKELNITELAKALGVSRRTLYIWFQQPQLPAGTLEKISKVVVYDFSTPDAKPSIVTPGIVERAIEVMTTNNEEYWKDKYVDLLERYSSLLLAARNEQVEAL
jgi:DNA-binding phage protein